MLITMSKRQILNAFLSALLCAAPLSAATPPCAPPGFESAMRVEGRKAVQPYIDVIRYQRIHNFPRLDLLMFQPEYPFEVVPQVNASAWVDVFINADGTVQRICYSHGDNRLMRAVVKLASPHHFESLNHGARVIVPLRWDLTWQPILFGPSVWGWDFQPSAP